ncbi:MAG: hypothetical protein MUC96_29145 [Myxococcaceae bacterium]|nr:hypothetical protein [Myxococcaceae bacterium]
MNLLRGVIVGVMVASCVAQNPAFSVCGIDGGAAPGVPLTLTASFDVTGCASPSARCTVSLDGGALVFDTIATVCSRGFSREVSFVGAPCAVPALAPGTYDLPGPGVLLVNTDGGATSCTPRGFGE